MSPIINWMGGWPKEGLVSAADWEERLAETARRTGKTDPSGGSARKDSQGDERLRDRLAHSLLKDKTGGSGRNLIVTAGADGALARILDTRLSEGDSVLVNRLTSRSALQAFRKAGLRTIAVDGDRHGMHPEALTTALYRFRPKMVYVSFACGDPEGLGWSDEKKKAAKERCKEAGALLVTDDRQEPLIFDAEGENGARMPDSGVLSVGQLPPGLISGLRCGWIAGTPDTLHAEGASGQPSIEASIDPLEQLALAELIEEQPLEPLMEMLRIQCGERMKKMTDMLAQKRIPDLTWVTPRGGLHLWVQLPGGLDGESLLRGAWLKGLIFQPGSAFYASSPLPNTLRITHAFADERQMKLGVSRLAESIEEFTGRWSVT